MMPTPRRLSVRDESGIALVFTILVMMVMSGIAFVTLEAIKHEQKSSYAQTNKTTAYQAAEAGIADYRQKLKDDPQYFLHYVHPAEATRRSSTNVNVGTTGTSWWATWPYTNTWTYPNGKDNWVTFTGNKSANNNFQYDLQITPPSASSPNLTITSTGRPNGDTNTKNYRVLQEVLEPNNIARYYRIVENSVSFANVTTTNGLVWANGNITHSGTATANLYAGGTISMTTSSPGQGLTNGAQMFPNQTPIDFTSFLTSFTDVSQAASVNSPSTNFPTVSGKSAWKFVFNSNGTFTAQTCTAGSSAIEDVAPSCDAATIYTVPVNGAIYSAMDVLVEGSVTGRVTVASYGTKGIIVTGPLNPTTGGTDVIGLNSLNDVILAQYCAGSGQDFTWKAAIIAQNGTWMDTGSVTHDVLTFRGMAVTSNGGSFGTFPGAHDYGYDTNLTFLQPPWFPSLGDPWVVALYRELPPA